MHMDAKKIIGVSILVAIMAAFGVVIVKQMSTVSEMPTNSGTPKTSTPVKPGLTEEAQPVVMDTKQPATVDAIVSDIDSEIMADEAAIAGEAAGEAAVIEEEAGALNEVSEFYDENNL